MGEGTLRALTEAGCSLTLAQYFRPGAGQQLNRAADATAAAGQPAGGGPDSAGPSRDEGAAAPINPGEGSGPPSADVGGAQPPPAGAGAAPERPELSPALRSLLATWPALAVPDPVIVVSGPACARRASGGEADPNPRAEEVRVASACAEWEAEWARVAMRAGAPGELGGARLVVMCPGGPGCFDMRVGDRTRRKGSKREMRSAAASPAVRAPKTPKLNRAASADARPGRAASADARPTPTKPIPIETRETAYEALGPGWVKVETRQGHRSWQASYRGPDGRTHPTLAAAEEAIRAAAEAAEEAAAWQTLPELVGWLRAAAAAGVPPESPGSLVNAAAIRAARKLVRGRHVGLRERPGA